MVRSSQEWKERERRGEGGQREMKEEEYNSIKGREKEKENKDAYR